MQVLRPHSIAPPHSIAKTRIYKNALHRQSIESGVSTFANTFTCSKALNCLASASARDKK
jgi:hypothetical protein